MILKKLPFSRQGRFYPIVINYLAAKFGFRELNMRGIDKKIIDAQKAGVDLLQDKKSFDEKSARIFSKRVASGIAPFVAIELSRTNGENLEFDDKDVTDICDVIDEEDYYLLDLVGEEHFRNWNEKSLLLSAYTIVDNLGLIKRGESELIEFFWHARNASAHDGKFYFRWAKNEDKREPQYDAIFRSFVIRQGDRSLQGEPLFYDYLEENGLIKEGDVLELLYEIERYFGESLMNKDESDAVPTEEAAGLQV